MSCAEKNVLLKKRGILAQEKIGDNKQKISPNLAKRTDFFVHQALILVRVFITKLLKILCFTAFKTYSNRALPIKNR